MTENSSFLTEADCLLLQSMSQLTGKTESELLHEALNLLKVKVENRRSLLQRARGIWRDRDDLPTLTELRSEADCSVGIT
jgi:hypothetical protein